MNGTGQKDMPLILSAAKKADLTCKQVKAWIKRTNFRKRHQKGESGTVKKVYLSSWQQFQKEFVKSKVGKEASKISPSEFQKVASAAYKKTDKRPEPTYVSRPMTEGNIRKRAKRIFESIKCKLNELEDMGYQGFAFGFRGDDAELVGTSTALERIDSTDINYLHSLVSVGNGPPIRYEKGTLVAHYRSSEMRNHLLSCFINKEMTRFPLEKERRVGFGGKIRKTVTERIYCHCRMPNYDRNMDMVKCNMCMEWFHFKCVGIDNVTRRSKWFCKDCKVITK